MHCNSLIRVMIIIIVISSFQTTCMVYYTIFDFRTKLRLYKGINNSIEGISVKWAASITVVSVLESEMNTKSSFNFSGDSSVSQHRNSQSYTGIVMWCIFKHL
ncbi:unnamed protein product [Heterobilharzia americana]|nr:unnamed protein product [Heterobilharzia americana]CAH8628831.1 unnamed protein product [Heterobilharzia americana]